MEWWGAADGPRRHSHPWAVALAPVAARVLRQPCHRLVAALQSAVLSPDGKRLYVTTGLGRSVAILDPIKKVTVGMIDDVGAFPRGIAISRDGKKLYTANGPSNDVAIIDIASKKVESRVPVTGAPWAVVLQP